jgi:hypothetical protein
MDSSRKLVICATMAALLLSAAGRAEENPDISLKAAQIKEAKVGVGVFAILTFRRSSMSACV